MLRRILPAVLLAATVGPVGCATPVGPVGCATPAGPEREAPFDPGAVDAAARTLRSLDPGGSVRSIAWSEDGRTLSFERLGEDWTYDLRAHGLALRADDDGDRATAAAPRRRRPPRGRQRDVEPSPDGRWSAVCRDWNVVLEATDGDDEIAVTTGGTRKHRYGKASWVYGEELDQQTAMWWSPDGRWLAYYEFDERAVPDFPLLEGLTELRSRTVVEGYPKPGEANPVARLHVYDIDTGATRLLATDPGDGDEWYVYAIRFTPDGDELLFHRTNRRQNVLHLVAADPRTGATRVVVRETQETWQENRPLLRFLADGARFVWETERDGFRQYELRNLDGRRLAGLTDDPFPVLGVERIVEDAEGTGGVLFYTAASADHPLNRHLYRVRLDGTDRRRLTAPGRSHAVDVAPDGAWFVDRAETIALPPVTTLHDGDGRLVATLAEPLPERQAAWTDPPGELFTCRAADGETELWGWIFRPRDFDPGRRYPLLIDVYGGPTSQGVRNTWRAGHAATALGCVVAKIDNRGTSGRGRAFRDAVYMKLGTVDLDDQAAGARHLAVLPWIDPERIGIYGHSYGGTMAALAVLRYPDLFRVAVAGAPVTDWRNYDTIYTERYMRTPAENPAGYEASSCVTYAEALSGRLLLLHGMVDDNVHPNNAWQVVHALQEAGKQVDMVFYPNATHGLPAHARRARWTYLHRHLVLGTP